MVYSYVAVQVGGLEDTIALFFLSPVPFSLASELILLKDEWRYSDWSCWCGCSFARHKFKQKYLHL